MNSHITLALSLLLLAGCGDSASGNKTSTKLDAVEVQPGTISDSMIILDDSSVDGTAVDNSAPIDPNAKSDDKAEDSKEEAVKTDEAEPDDGADIDAPVAKASEPEKK